MDSGRFLALDQPSSFKTTFNSPYGRYHFLRLPFEIRSAQAVFQKAMDYLFSDCPCEIVVNDMLIWGETEEEHDAKLCRVLDRAREVNLKLKLKKLESKATEISDVGHLLTEDGALAKFVPSLSDMTAPLCSLLHSDNA